MEEEIKEEIKDIPWKKRFLTLIMLPLEHKLKFWIFPRLIKTHLPVKLLPRDINESGAKVLIEN